MEAMGYCRIKKIISLENVGWVVGSRVGGEVYGKWKLWDIVEQKDYIMGKCPGAELCQARVKLEVIVEADLYLELKMKLATTILCDWVD